MYVRRGMGGPTLTSPIAGDPIISSLFGPRAQPTPGASTNHQGIDYAVPVGTSFSPGCNRDSETR
jgi:murein DD-endopeptidase MepM/ murein hydrolase activator NlpD